MNESNPRRPEFPTIGIGLAVVQLVAIAMPAYRVVHVCTDERNAAQVSLLGGHLHTYLFANPIRGFGFYSTHALSPWLLIGLVPRLTGAVLAWRASRRCKRREPRGTSRVAPALGALSMSLYAYGVVAYMKFAVAIVAGGPLTLVFSEDMADVLAALIVRSTYVIAATLVVALVLTPLAGASLLRTLWLWLTPATMIATAFALNIETIVNVHT